MDLESMETTKEAFILCPFTPGVSGMVGLNEDIYFYADSFFRFFAL